MSIRSAAANGAPARPTRSYAALCQAVERGPRVPISSSRRAGGAPLVAFVPFRPEHAAAKPTKTHESVVLGLFEEMDANETAPTAAVEGGVAKKAPKKAKAPKATLSPEEIVAQYDDDVESIDAELLAIATKAKKRVARPDAPVTLKDLTAEAQRLKQQIKLIDGHLTALKAIGQVVKATQASATKKAANNLLEANEDKQRQLRKVAEQDKQQKEDAELAEAAKLEGEAAAKGLSVPDFLELKAKLKSPEGKLNAAYDEYLATMAATKPGEPVKTKEEFAAEEEAKRKADAAAAGALTRKYNAYLKQLEEGNSGAQTTTPMTKEEYGEFLKTQAKAGVSAKAAEEQRRAALTPEERSAEDKAEKVARASKGAETKRYKEYLAKMEDKGESQLSKEAWVVMVADKEARKQYKMLRKALVENAKSGNTTESPAFFKALIDAFTELASVERARLEALTPEERTYVANTKGDVTYDTIKADFEERAKEFLAKLNEWKAGRETAVREEFLKVEQEEAQAKAAAEVEKVANARYDLTQAMRGLYETRWQLLEALTEDVQKHLAVLGESPYVSPTIKGFDEESGQYDVEIKNPQYNPDMNRELHGAAQECLKLQWVTSLVTALDEIKALPSLGATNAAYNIIPDPITQEAYQQWKQTFENEEEEEEGEAEGGGEEDDEDDEDDEGGEEDNEGEAEGEEDDEGEEEEEEGDDNADGMFGGGDEAEDEELRGSVLQFRVKGSDPYVPDASTRNEAEEEAARTRLQNIGLEKAQQFVKSTLVPRLSEYMRGHSFLYAPMSAELYEEEQDNGVWFRLQPGRDADEQVRAVARASFKPQISLDTEYEWIEKVPFPEPRTNKILDKNNFETGKTETVGVGIFTDDDKAFEYEWDERDGTVLVTFAVEPLTNEAWPEERRKTSIPASLQYTPPAKGGTPGFGTSASAPMVALARTKVIATGTAFVQMSREEQKAHIVHMAEVAARRDERIAMDAYVARLLSAYLKTVLIEEWRRVTDAAVVVDVKVEPEIVLGELERVWIRASMADKWKRWNELPYNEQRGIIAYVSHKIEVLEAKEKYSVRSQIGGPKETAKSKAVLANANQQRRAELEKTTEGRATLATEEKAEAAEQKRILDENASKQATKKPRTVVVDSDDDY